MPFDFPQGSQWRKWDLHTHTPIDHQWINRPDLTSEAAKVSFAHDYVLTALDQQLAVVAITDHNFCETEDELIIPYIQSEAADTSLCILPGFEISVSDCGGTHLLVIFREDTSLSIIDHIVKQLFPPGKSRFQNHNVMPTHKSAIDLQKFLIESGLDHLIIFAHADRDNGVLNQRRSTSRATLWQSPFISIAQVSKDPRLFTGFMKNIFERKEDKYSRKMAWLIASDCRQLQQNDSTDARFSLGQKFTWIKADPTFEGLRQIVHEPQDRARIQEHEPDIKSNYLVIDSVQFIDDNQRFQSQPIPINAGLTVIVGGKSTGKSILLTTIAKSIDPHEVFDRTQVSSVNLYNFDGLDFIVTWRDGTTDMLSNPSKQHKITFLPQMYIHKLVEGDNRLQLSQSILRFLRQNDDFDTEYSRLIREIETLNGRLQSEISELLITRSTQTDVNLKLREFPDQSAIELELEIIASKQKGLRESSGFTDQETLQYQEYSSQLDEISLFISRSKRFDAAISELHETTGEIIEDARYQIASLVDDLSSKHQLSPQDKQRATALVDQLSTNILKDLETFLAEVIILQEQSVGRNKKNDQDLLAANTGLKPFLAKIKNQMELTELQETDQSLRSTLEAIHLRTAEKNTLELRFKSKLESLRRLLEAHLSLKEDLSALFADPTYAAVDVDTSIVATMNFNQDHFQTIFLQTFDHRTSLDRLGASFTESDLIWSKETHVKTILNILATLLTKPLNEIRLRSEWTLEDVIPKLLTDYLEHKFSVLQEDEDLLLMSPGKKGLILLELFLHLSSANYPILIDQPEDNLDNRTVYTHLSRFIRKKKIDRQIIIVSHNPNLVVGTDAEEVIVANQDGEGHGENETFRFEYVSGALECSFLSTDTTYILKTSGIREHVCQILEGGADAFRLREKRYDLGQEA